MRPAPTLHPAAALLAKTALTSDRLAMVKRSYNTRCIVSLIAVHPPHSGAAAR